MRTSQSPIPALAPRAHVLSTHAPHHHPPGSGRFAACTHGSKGRRSAYHLAGFEMLYWGKFKEENKTRLKFVCHIIHSKKFRKEHPFCPWMHPQFTKGTGCFTYIQILTEDVRKQIAYGTPKFKKVYNLRSECKRIFSRLLDLCMQNPSVRGLRTVSNHCTIAHITVLLVALTAAKTGNKDKIRFVKSFLSNI